MPKMRKDKSELCRNMRMWSCLLYTSDKGSKALSEITSNRKHIYVQRIATIFQTGGYYPPLRHEMCIRDRVKAAYSSGKPALGVGAGNTPAIIDETADILLAVNSIIHSKTFDNGMTVSYTHL